LSEKVELTPEKISQIKDAANEFKTTVLNYFKDHNVEVKDWKFAVENSDETYTIDIATKIVIKPKTPPK
jgi:hypothetical protein